MLSALPPSHPARTDLVGADEAGGVTFQHATADFQRRLQVPLGDGRAIDAAFPGILVPDPSRTPTSKLPSNDVEAYLDGISALARTSATTAGARTTSSSALGELLASHGGALHFRSTPLRTAADFSRFLYTIAGQQGWRPHVDKGLMVLRKPHADNVATANEGPPYQPIGSHNEYGLSTHFPRYIAFFCLSPPQQGGQTPIASSLKLYHDLEREVPEYIAALRDEGVAFTIHHPRDTIEGCIQGNALFSSSAFGPSEGVEGVVGLDEDAKRKVVESNVDALAAEGGWTPTLHRDEPTAPHWKKRGFSATWNEDGSVLVTQRVPGVRDHPSLGAKTYFNNIHNRFAYSRAAGALQPPHIAKNQTTAAGRPFYQFPPHIVGEREDRPVEERWTRVADEVTARNQVDVEWSVGDVLLLDNLAVQHARRTWKGDRRLLASLWDGADE
ncbi:uncharacterized protein PFL1_06038 [Pseudozyma flocculosa PF-1]|uniref:TauD/TfdA-like domain-containing protein n=2 Tax=Pseudozyma flocculosa TaxID=84751 RepID=A0A5C3F3K8_9BASI|nr:uncharacterized protein PFL1_06038 [Pseudozyma flocculosa PF-1]EPQ26390.1 hypothetical protein PFL1_06038 [Pseudozyma flocculosa PF-1]SPO39018.1 uncharacterized protein PSFLO_04497 [Pseudozyma flocculosa]